MQIYLDESLEESVNNDEGSFKLNLGVCKAGSEVIKEFWIKNDKDVELRDIHMTLRPVVIREGKSEKDYTKCLQEVTISHFPKKLKANESHRFEISYAPMVGFLRGLRFDMEITGTEVYS